MDADRRSAAILIGLVSGSLLMGVVVGIILLIIGGALLVAVFFLAFYVMGDPCSRVAQLLGEPRPPFC